MCSGFMILPREIRRWGWYRNSKMVHMLIHLLMEAQYQDGSYMGIEIKRGQLATGRKQLSAETGMSEREVRTCLERLENDQQIVVKTTNKFSIITVCNYDSWQNVKIVNDHQTTNKTHKNDQQSDTLNDHIQINNKDNNKDNNKEEDTNVSKKKTKSNVFVKPTVEEVDAYIKEKGFHFNAERFHSFYESNGWMVGKNKMRDWKAACRTWEIKTKEESPSLFSYQEDIPRDSSKIEWQ